MATGTTTSTSALSSPRRPHRSAPPSQPPSHTGSRTIRKSPLTTPQTHTHTPLPPPPPPPRVRAPALRCRTPRPALTSVGRSWPGGGGRSGTGALCQQLGPASPAGLTLSKIGGSVENGVSVSHRLCLVCLHCLHAKPAPLPCVLPGRLHPGHLHNDAQHQLRHQRPRQRHRPDASVSRVKTPAVPLRCFCISDNSCHSRRAHIDVRCSQDRSRVYGVGQLLQLPRAPIRRRLVGHAVPHHSLR